MSALPGDTMDLVVEEAEGASSTITASILTADSTIEFLRIKVHGSPS